MTKVTLLKGANNICETVTFKEIPALCVLSERKIV